MNLFSLITEIPKAISTVTSIANGMKDFANPDKKKKRDWLKANLKFIAFITAPVCVVLIVLIYKMPDVAISMLTKIIDGLMTLK